MRRRVTLSDGFALRYCVSRAASAFTAASAVAASEAPEAPDEPSRKEWSSWIVDTKAKKKERARRTVGQVGEGTAESQVHDQLERGAAWRHARSWAAWSTWGQRGDRQAEEALGLRVGEGRRGEPVRGEVDDRAGAGAECNAEPTGQVEESQPGERAPPQARPGTKFADADVAARAMGPGALVRGRWSSGPRLRGPRLRGRARRSSKVLSTVVHEAPRGR